MTRALNSLPWMKRGTLGFGVSNLRVWLAMVVVVVGSSSSAWAFSPLTAFPTLGNRPFLDSAATTTTTTTTQRFATVVNDDEASTSTSSTTVPQLSPLPSKKEGVGMGRVLGSQELLMLPRQYRPNGDNTESDIPTMYPPVCHAASAWLSSTPSTSRLREALEEARAVHPLLRARVVGSGEPTPRIDAFQMVRDFSVPTPDPERFEVYNEDETNDDDEQLLEVVVADSFETLESQWTRGFRRCLDHGPPSPRLWSARLDRVGKGDDYDDDESLETKSILTLSFNHVISDQSSANLVLDQIVAYLNQEGNEILTRAPPVPVTSIPPSTEDSMLQRGNDDNDNDNSSGTFASSRFQGGLLTPAVLSYVWDKAQEGAADPVLLLPSKEETQTNSLVNALTTITGRVAGGKTSTQPTDQTVDDPVPDSGGRATTLEFRTFPVKDLLEACRRHKVTVTAALTAAATLTCAKFVESQSSHNSPPRTYKVLQSLDMRRFFDDDQKVCETVSLAAGSMDLMLGPLSLPNDNDNDDDNNNNNDITRQFWELALESKAQTMKFFKSGGPEHAVRVFDAGMQLADMNRLIHLQAVGESTKGRAYSVGVTNAGVFERQTAVRRQDTDSSSSSTSPPPTLTASLEYDNDNNNNNNPNTPTPLQKKKYRIENLYYASSHARSGSLFPVSCLTLNDELQLTFHPAEPLVSPELNRAYADSFVHLLKEVSSEDVDAPVTTTNPTTTTTTTNELMGPVAAASTVFASMALHATAWADFAADVNDMVTSGADDVGAAINFWIFFAVGHPLLQPILWISDVLHGSPGPKVLGEELVPLTYLVANVAVLGVVAASKELQSIVNTLLLSAFLAYVGAGLEGQGGLGDYNLALNRDKSTPSTIVKGCPAYQDVRQPSMDGFDLEKYQGKWYEHKFHDWTQFKEVYDTTLDIKLTADGRGWIDDFGVKGPAPKSARLSWDKSPVANGAHYFLFGRVDENDPPGVLRESGFGVEFPNYIVDVQKDPTTGEYKEAIQFQCLERGGVRVFEGINFMSRDPDMSDDALTAMHARAEQAGMYPYGASPEQMHRVDRRLPVDAPPIDNNWQRMWKSLGVDRLLQLLTESIEDGGR